MSGGWDYVVIQGQSQEPITLPGQFNTNGLALHHKIKQYNPCAVTVAYMTWGMKNGDASNCATFPVMCTYQQMDSALKRSYLNLSSTINGEVAPVSVVWNYLRQNHPGIELYQADGSHPSAAGSYAAACCFYATLFKKDPTLISFNFGLNPAQATIIKNAVKAMVFDSLHLWDLKKLPVSRFVYQIGSGLNEVVFSPSNQGVLQTYSWDFGDGTNATATNPAHSYLNNGTYTVSLTTSNCDLQGLHTSSTDTVIQFCDHTPEIYTSNPWLCNYDTLRTQPADGYQWFLYGAPLPETNQTLPDYARYNTSGFSVLSTVNGCSELSRVYGDFPQSSGYYFDALGDPCSGDTVAFAVLHTNGALSGSEHILWYKDGTLLPWATNHDTLLIATSGTYECQVINPSSLCPLDTSSARVQYNCGPVSINAKSHKESIHIFPNPASETITINCPESQKDQSIHIYNASGSLMSSLIVSGITIKINIADLPKGLYYMLLRDSKYPVLKFIRH